MKNGCLGRTIGSFDINKRTWQIDHIIPQSHLLFETLDDENFLKCWALENLRPLDAKENLEKQDKILGELSELRNRVIEDDELVS